MAWLLGLWYFSGSLFAFLYYRTIRYFRGQWQVLPLWQIPEGFIPATRISVLIPARNEEASIGACLRSVLNQSYPAPLYEIIVIDDHSTDRTVEVAQEFLSPQMRLLRLQDLMSGEEEPASFKKKALELGVTQAVGDLIVTTDADCEVPADWLLLLASCYQQLHPVFIAAPVNFYRERNLLQRFQSLDFLGMMLLTGGGLHSGRLLSANGANLAYEREAFLAAGAYTDIDTVASGDDYFLLHKFSRLYPDRLFFLRTPEAVVHTEACPDLSSFVQQRLRWATKNAGADLRTDQTTAILVLVFLFCWSILLTPFLALTGGVPALAFGLSLLLLKSAVDYGMLREAALFFGRSQLLRVFWPSQGLHILYIAFIGLAANLVKRYRWKGRRVR